MRYFKVVALVFALALPFTAFAQYYGNNGNTYNSYGSGYRGYNSNTGSTWSAQSYGNVTRGTDSRGNSWSYDRNSGVYQNYGTGEIRQNGQSTGSIYYGR